MSRTFTHSKENKQTNAHHNYHIQWYTKGHCYYQNHEKHPLTPEFYNPNQSNDAKSVLPLSSSQRGAPARYQYKGNGQQQKGEILKSYNQDNDKQYISKFGKLEILLPHRTILHLNAYVFNHKQSQ